MIRNLAKNYDGFIVDLWGVIHDGIKTYPGVVDCLTHLREAGKSVVFLSNAPRRAAAIGRALAAMGIGEKLYTGIMSSGEAVHTALRDRTDPDFFSLGTILYHLGPTRDRDIFDSLPLTESTAPARRRNPPQHRADDYLGPNDPSIYEPVLRECLAASLPMICANPDLEVIRNGERIICAGLLAQWYAAHGGRVINRGKPDPAIYIPTLALLGTAKPRTLAIGDSLRTDMAGAAAAGLDACWVLSGVDVSEADAAKAGIRPVATLPGFIW